MAFIYQVHETETGEYIGPIELIDVTWERKLNEIEMYSATYVVPSDTPEGSVETWLRDWRRCIVAVWEDPNQPLLRQAVWAGIIQDKDYVPATGRYTLDMVGYRGVFTRRNTLGVDGYEGGKPAPAGIWSYSNKSGPSAIGELIVRGTSGPDGGGNEGHYALPLDYPARNGTGAFSATHADYNFPSIEEELTRVQGEPGGPDVDFWPFLTEANDLRIRVYAANPYRYWEDVDVVMGAASSGLIVEKYSVLGSAKLRRIYATGDGSERAMPVRSWGGWTEDAPALDGVISYPGVKTLDDLGRAVEGDYMARREVVRVWDLSGVCSEYPGVIRIRPGVQIRMIFPERGEPNADPIIRGTHVVKVVGLSGTDGEALNFTVETVS